MTKAKIEKLYSFKLYFNLILFKNSNVSRAKDSKVANNNITYDYYYSKIILKTPLASLSFNKYSYYSNEPIEICYLH